jgi:CubicO group peptidase (beta-lactamase class C family)
MDGYLNGRYGQRNTTRRPSSPQHPRYPARLCPPRHYFGTHRAEKQHDLHSVTKSYLSTLAGMAHDRGLLPDMALG